MNQSDGKEAKEVIKSHSFCLLYSVDGFYKLIFMQEQEVIVNLSTRDSCGVFPGSFVTVREYFVSGPGGESTKPQVIPAEGEHFPGNPEGCFELHIAIP